MSKTFVLFRNDDVNRIEPGLVEVTDLLAKYQAPISHAVEPANLESDCRDFLLERCNDGVEIIQHGFAHVSHDRGEFGGSRSREDQKEDLVAGLQIMEDNFGDSFFKAMSFPFGSYNEYSIPLLEELGYPVVSCHWRHQFSRKVFYGLGRMLGKGRWMDRHISHHLRNYPGTQVMEISVTVPPIRAYYPDQGTTACAFRSLAELQSIFKICQKTSPVVGIVLHHRYRSDPSALGELEQFISWLKDQPEVEFTCIEKVYEKFGSKGNRVGQ